MADPRREALAAWEEAAGGLTWDQPWSAAYRDDRPGGSWFPGGMLNASVNCLDRHLPERASQVAIQWEGEIQCRVQAADVRALAEEWPQRGQGCGGARDPTAVVISMG